MRELRFDHHRVGMAAAAIGIALGANSAAHELRAATPTPGNFRILAVGPTGDGDKFPNYDQTERPGWNPGSYMYGYAPTAGISDWPVTVIFYNDADIGVVKGIYWNESAASEQYMWLSDGSVTGPSPAAPGVPGLHYDEDKGTKYPGLSACADLTTDFIHMRLYADNPGLGGDDRLYNQSWGYYVLGTTHFDKDECTAGPIPGHPDYGWSEDAAATVVATARAKGYYVGTPVPLGNREWPIWTDANDDYHHWQSDGNADMINITRQAPPTPTPTRTLAPTRTPTRTPTPVIIPVPPPAPCTGKCP